MKRPSVEASLRPLKPFQRRTVEHAFHRLFEAKDGTGRFLVADEVGLGKTLVARGIIARAIDHLWNDVGRIDVVYICSNGSIARANLPKLQVGGAEERSFALATRLTMLATELARREGESGFADSKLNFVSFTPGTSFKLGHSAGQGREREVLFQLLDPLVGPRIALMNLLQGGITKRDNWRWRLENNPRLIDETIRESFDAAFRERPDLRDRLRELLDTWFRRYRAHWPAEARHPRDRVISDLRRVLAGACVKALEPDLVILDEFQRFKNLLGSEGTERDSAADLAQELFQAAAHDKKRVRTLLLSATPYKLYTADAEIEHEEHYEDFLATTRFLLGDDEARVEELKHQLSRFGAALRRAARRRAGPGGARRAGEAGGGRLPAGRDGAHRTGRGQRRSGCDGGRGPAHDARHRERCAAVPRRRCAVPGRRQPGSDAVLEVGAVSRALHARLQVPRTPRRGAGYAWSAGQDRRCAPAARFGLSEGGDAAVVGTHRPRARQAAEAGGRADRRGAVAPAVDAAHGGVLAAGGTVRGKEHATKRLLFSAWNVVPEVVSAVLSYEAERLMGGRLDSYDNPDKEQRPLLRLTQSTAGVRSRHRLLLLLLPCLPLADRAHPLGAPPGQDRRAWVRAQVDDLLSDPGLPNPPEGSVDDRWEWAAPLLLDPELPTFLRAWRDGELSGASDNEPLPQPNPDVFGAYVDELLAVDLQSLGRRPTDLPELLTDLALGSPAILAARSLRGGGDIGDDTRRRLAVLIADAFWRLFNRPAVITLLRQIAAAAAAVRDESAYWRLVLHYCQQGNLQAVLDEQWHLLWEQDSWSEDASAEETAAKCARKLVQVVHPARARVHAGFFRPERGASGARVERDETRVRTVFALRFGHVRTDDGEHISQDAVRAAFNSPFRPFVLTSTSIGQEGLDFHPWCHRLVHWNLPGNPVDLEQREGRIHRYKGHAVRRMLPPPTLSPPCGRGARVRTSGR